MAATLKDYDVRILRYNITSKQYVLIDPIHENWAARREWPTHHPIPPFRTRCLSIEVKLKKGFVYGTTTGVAIRLFDTSTRQWIAKIFRPNHYPDEIAERKFLEKTINQHQPVTVHFVSDVVVGGTRRTDVSLALVPIAPDQSSSFHIVLDNKFQG